MTFSTSKSIKVTLTLLAVVLLFCAPMFSTTGKVSALAEPPTERTGLKNGVERDIELNVRRNSPNLILLNRGIIDTSLDSHEGSHNVTQPGASLAASPDPSRKELRIVQFAGPVKSAWLDRLRATGFEIIGYVPNNAYVVRGHGSALARAARLSGGPGADEDRPIRWIGSLQPIQKIDPRFDDEMLSGARGMNVDVEIELIDSPDTARSLSRIKEIASRITREHRGFLKFLVVSATVHSGRLLELAALNHVLYINPEPAPELHDERGAQIIAANLVTEGTEPSGPGYREWLESKGFNTPSDFVIDFADSGLDNGGASGSPVHPDFLDSERLSRVAYNINYTNESFGGDRSGHGTFVASLACGSGTNSNADTGGYLFGLGIDPNARLGASRIFRDDGRLNAEQGFTQIVSSAYAAGARMSNNSWGRAGNIYDAAAQEYDALTRDAQPEAEGNQEILFIFSGGNSGPDGRISSPGTAKNVITVGASESYRPEGLDSCNFDGSGGIGPDEANNALDILKFSSGGPTLDGRTKPDIVAPGSHLYGAVSQTSLFNGDGLCPGAPRFQPPGVRLYTWSSGTSLAAPHVTGAAALVRRHFRIQNLLGDDRAPSPAMTKAYLLNSATYMTGENAGGNLPSQRQGWGLTNLSHSFDDTARKLVDQTELLTESGQVFEIRGSISDRTQPLRITLAWTDAVGMLAGPALVNDLDLELKVEGQTVYKGNGFAGRFSFAGGEADRLNNVESIYLPSDAIPEGVAGNFTITVRAANIAGDAVPGNGHGLDQDFALVAYNVADPVPETVPTDPVITGSTYVKKVLTVTGRNFTAASRVEINGQLVNLPFTFNANSGSLGIKRKAKKLKLITGADNQIVVIENNVRSLPFNLRL